MASEEQLEELDSLHAIYEGSDEVALAMHILEECPEGVANLQVTFSHSDNGGKEFLTMRTWLPYANLADGSSSEVPPVFELESSCISLGRLSHFCRHLDSIAAERDDGALLFTWLEWLRTEAWYTEDMCEDDARAMVVWKEPEHVVEKQQESFQSCENCGASGSICPVTCLKACGHLVCNKCISVSMQVEDACEAAHSCPMPQCRVHISPEDKFEECVCCPEAWMHVSRHILKTRFQDAVVFCPGCEDLGMDMPVLMPGMGHDADHDKGHCRCHCFRCGLRFCGICRSPCHPGQACFDEESRVVRMTKRRPPLAPELQDRATRIAEELVKTQEERAHEVAQSMQLKDFDGIRDAFLDAHKHAIESGLDSVLGPRCKIHRAPLSKVVIKRFMASLNELPPGCELRPAWHGTDAANHPLIFEQGLLIPGDDNQLKVVHGAAHGRGVYTANIDAAWLSRGFCTKPIMLICGVLQSNFVKHVGDAMVVSKSEHVVPLFYGESTAFASHEFQPGIMIPAPKVRVPTQTKQCVAATSSKPIKKHEFKALSADDKKSHKTSKWKASLEKQAKKH